MKSVNAELLRRTRNDVARLAGAGLDWVSLAAQATEILRRIVPFQRSCWHTVDPGTVLLTGSVNQNVVCSGQWLAEHEYTIEDVNKWSFLAGSGRLAGATSLATYGDLSRSARHRSHANFGIGDELRASFAIDGTYWANAGLLRNAGEPWFTEEEVRIVAMMCEPLADAFRRALLVALASRPDTSPETAPGLVLFDERGEAESVSPAAEHWIEQLVEIPPPRSAAESGIVRAVAARARSLPGVQDPLQLGARSRAQTRSGQWLLLYGTPLFGGGKAGRTAVIIQPAAASDVTPLVAMAYGLTERESQITRLCMKGQSTKVISRMLGVSPYTVQDHLKSIFDKTGVRSRGELVGRVFLEHYAPRWEELPSAHAGWSAKGFMPTGGTAAASGSRP